MADYVTIANMAASLIGEDDQIVTPNDDTHIGRTIRAVWDLCRRAAIRDHSWNCFMTRGALAAAVGAKPFPWSAAYPLPANCVRLIEVLNIAGADYELEGRRILCNASGPVYIRFLQDLAEPATWDDLFSVAFARRIAVQIGARIAGSSYDKSAGWQLYQDALSQAKRVDARENPPVEQQWTDWELARFGGGMRWVRP